MHFIYVVIFRTQNLVQKLCQNSFLQSVFIYLCKMKVISEERICLWDGLKKGHSMARAFPSLFQFKVTDDLFALILHSKDFYWHVKSPSYFDRCVCKLDVHETGPVTVYSHYKIPIDLFGGYCHWSP